MLLDIPETLIILLTAMLIVLGTRHWLTVNGVLRSGRNSNKSNR